MPIALLLAMQASGMIVDWLGTKNQAEMAGMGAKIQQQGIEMNIEQRRLEAEDASAQALRNLRKTLGTQAAVFAARGTNPGAGSALALTTESISKFGSEERTRRMNLMGDVATLKAGGALSKLNAQGENTKLWSSFASRSLNRFPTEPKAYETFGKSIGKSFGLTREA